MGTSRVSLGDVKTKEEWEMPTVQMKQTERVERDVDTRNAVHDPMRDSRLGAAPLDGQYRAIGISAVAAAMRYRPQPQAVYAPKLIREQD